MNPNSNSLVTRVPEFFKSFFSSQNFCKMKVPVEFMDQLTFLEYFLYTVPVEKLGE
ncbi:hypothetical protein MKX01_003294 [Papaver californicum]|nr:hypothetical protein MKX01_003294 [Papaver californicum]